MNVDLLTDHFLDGFKETSQSHIVLFLRFFDIFRGCFDHGVFSIDNSAECLRENFDFLLQFFRFSRAHHRQPLGIQLHGIVLREFLFANQFFLEREREGEECLSSSVRTLTRRKLSTIASFTLFCTSSSRAFCVARRSCSVASIFRRRSNQEEKKRRKRNLQMQYRSEANVEREKHM